MLPVRNSDTRGIRPAAPFQLILVATLLVSMNIGRLAAQQSAQKTYSSPQQAVQDLVTAVKADDPAQLMQILGPEAKAILYSGDPVADKTIREKFLEKYDQMNRLAADQDRSVTLYIGAENWPFPIPLVKKNNAWLFDTAAGKQDGLYWKTEKGQPPSPVGSLIAEAFEQGYRKQEGPVPYHGYIFRLLRSQGKDAPGGQKDYMVDGKLTRGFAFVAYPVEYRNSGVMTFIVNQDGKIYQKDLGPNTESIASQMTAYDPDKSWRFVE